jgi:hypothetical protein
MTRSKVRRINCKSGLEVPLNKSIENKYEGKSSYKNTTKFFTHTSSNSLVLFCALFTVAHQFPSVINVLAITYFPNPFFAVLHLIGLAVRLL